MKNKIFLKNFFLQLIFFFHSKNFFFQMSTTKGSLLEILNFFSVQENQNNFFLIVQMEMYQLL